LDNNKNNEQFIDLNSLTYNKRITAHYEERNDTYNGN
jgi:hypothetical protein